MTFETYVTTVNGHRAETGCYVDGHWGQYGPDHLASMAEDFGWTGDEFSDPRLIRAAIDDLEPSAAADLQEREASLWEAHSESADAIEQWLNDHTPDGFVWHWHDGEFFLSPICDDDENCADETCAHWSFG